MADDKPFYLSQNTGFVASEASDDFLHPDINARVDADSLTETQYLGFSVPEHRIQGFGYLWHHPNLGVVYGGVRAWQGEKLYEVAAELCDMHHYLSDKVLANDLHEYRLANSYGVKVVEPMRRLHMSYKDESRQNAIELDFDAISPAAKFGDGNHFEQAMRARGELVLRGKRYEVDCFSIRDRSWGKPRPEAIMAIPPVSWMTVVFNENFAINCTVMDDLRGAGELERFALPEDKLLNGGWVWSGGEIRRIVKAKKTVDRDPKNFNPKKISLQIEDETGGHYSLEGSLVGCCPWLPWNNMHARICQMQWECDGQVAYGETQDGIYNDYAELVSR